MVGAVEHRPRKCVETGVSEQVFPRALPLDGADVAVGRPAAAAGGWGVTVTASVRTTQRTGVEMEALAAAAVAFSLGVSLEHIRQGLRTFATSFFQAPGRCNVFDEHPFRVIVDYGHNPAAMAAMAELVVNMRRKRAIGILGAAGDRRNEDILELGRVAAGGFDFVIVKEDPDRRGRPVGEAASIVAEGLVQGGLAQERFVIDVEEPDAIDRGLAMAEPGDLLVIFADDAAAAWKKVIYFGKDRPSLLGTVDPMASELDRA